MTQVRPVAYGQRVLVSFCTVVVVALAGADAKAERRDLYVSECFAPGGACRKIDLVRYSFKDGHLHGKENLARFRTGQVRFDLGQTRQVDESFVVSEWGDVIDLRTGELLHDGIGTVMEVADGLIVQRVQRKGLSGYFTYDLRSKRYSELPEPTVWELPGVLAPDRHASASVSNGDLVIHHPDGSNRVLASELSAQLSPLSSSLPSPPVMWINKDHILTQEANGHLIIVGLDGTIRSLAQVQDDNVPIANPRLSRGPDGIVLYSYGHSTYEVSVVSGRVSRLAWLPISSDFSIELHEEKTRGRGIRYRGKWIGEYWCLLHPAVTAEGYLAIEFGPVGSNLGYPKGVAVWTEKSGEWIEIEIDFIQTLLGWTGESPPG